MIAGTTWGVGNLTRFCIETTGSQEISCKVNVNITEEEQNVLAAPPSPGTHV